MIKLEKILPLFMALVHPDALDCSRMVGVGLQRHEQCLFCIRIG